MDIGSLLCSESPATPSYPATPSHEPSPMQVLAAPSTFVHWTPPYDPPSPVQPSVASPPPIQEDDIPPMPPLTLDLPNVPTPDPILPAPQSRGLYLPWVIPCGIHLEFHVESMESTLAGASAVFLFHSHHGFHVE